MKIENNIIKRKPVFYKYASWLPPLTINFIKDYYKGIEEVKDIKNYNKMYLSSKKRWERIEILFNDLSMKEIWEKIRNKSEDLSLEFAKLILSIELSQEVISDILINEKHKRCEIKKIFKDLKRIKSRIQNKVYLNSYENVFNNFCKSLLENISNYLKDEENVLKYCDYSIAVTKEHFNKSRFNNRQVNNDKGLAICFMRNLSAFFKKYFNKPMNSKVIKIVNLIFDAEYTNNEVSKAMKKYNNLEYIVV